MMVEVIGSDGLPALIHVHMFDGLLTWLVQLGQSFDGRFAVTLSFHSQPCVALGSVQILAHVKRCPSSKLSEHAVQS